MALINPKNSILNGFGKLEKSFEIIKTEKEIFSVIDEKINRLTNMLGHIEGVKKEIVILLGEQPTEERTFYFSGDIDSLEEPTVVYMTYKLFNDGCCQKEPVISNMTVNDMTNYSQEDDEREGMKNRYNDISRKFYSIQEKLRSLNILKRNLKKNSGKEIKLTLSELENYGF